MRQELQDEVWHRARDRCEYCGVPQSAHLVPFQIDHIVALKHRGPTVSENLALACFHCNNHKGTDIASIDPTTGDLTRLFHPRTDRWSDQFVLLADGQIEGLTPAARATSALLNLNAPDSVILRASLILEGVLLAE